jgi:LysW-gamma-L-lysine carboxypeptidase
MNAERLLTGLLKLYNPTGSEAEAVRYLTEQMSRAGLDSEIDAVGSAVGRIGSGDRRVLLLGHIDTAPGEILVRKQGDLLFGRGAVDAKGPLAAFVAAAALGPLPGLHVTVVGAVHEEGDSVGATHLRDHFPAPDALIIGEPSGWERVTLGYKGWVTYTLTAETDTAHPASDKANACEIAIAAWDALMEWTRDFNAGRSRAFEQLIPTLRAMQSESDGLRERAQLRVTFRLPEGLAAPEIHSKVLQLIGPGIEIETLPAAVPAFRAPKNTALVRAALAAIRAEGGTPRFVVKTGTSDMNMVAPAWGCPTIAYGPGDSSLDHTPKEHISLAEFQRSITVLRGILERLSSAGA